MRFFQLADPADFFHDPRKQQNRRLSLRDFLEAISKIDRLNVHVVELRREINIHFAVYSFILK